MKVRDLYYEKGEKINIKTNLLTFTVKQKLDELRLDDSPNQDKSQSDIVFFNCC